MTDSQTHYDVIVIGAGPAGYTAALRCAQLGLKTACIDNWLDKNGQSGLGGFFLNAGCLASLALLESAKIYYTLTHELKNHGISAQAVTLDVAQMVKRKDDIIQNLRLNIAESFAYHHIDRYPARGRLLNNRQVEVTFVDDAVRPTVILEANHIILATSSTPIKLACAPVDNEFIIDSVAALNLTAVPKKLAIIGAGVVGLELASIWSRLGVEVILLDAQEKFLSLLDEQLATEAFQIYTSQGLEIRMGARVTSAKKDHKKVTIDYQDRDGTHTLRVDKLIVASGRTPNTESLADPNAELLLDENGYVHVNENCRTNLPSVYAIGDLSLLGPMLAHKGIEEGVFVAEQIAGIHNPIDYDVLPSVIYTDPEIAWVGQTEQALRAMGESIKVSSFPLKTNVRAQATGKTEGLVKMIAHADTDALLGVHIISSHASELIAEAVLAMEFSASSEDLARTIHAHPTLCEALHEAALGLKNKSLYSLLSK
ncbi:MAG: dihydrolipoyl dehydrogenase [Methylococcales bacterium]|nr:dihydrolipoyl dehydrogenase [Methylococcales bacterium]